MNFSKPDELQIMLARSRAARCGVKPGLSFSPNITLPNTSSHGNSADFLEHHQPMPARAVDGLPVGEHVAAVGHGRARR